MLRVTDRAGPHPGLAQPSRGAPVLPGYPCHRVCGDRHSCPGPLWLQHLPCCTDPGSHPRCSVSASSLSQGPSLCSGDMQGRWMGLTHWDGPGTGGRKETLSCLALGTRQETRSDSFVKGHTMPAHPTSPVGKRQAAASFPRRSHSSRKAEVRSTPILEPPRDTQSMSQHCAQRCSSVLAQTQETATARGHLPPLRGQLGPGTRGREAGHVPGSGEAHLCPGYALLLCRGQARGLGSHFCVCWASRDQASLNIVTARVATCEQREGGGAAHITLPKHWDGAGTEHPGSAPRGSASPELLTTLTESEGEQGIKSAPALRQQS